MLLQRARDSSDTLFTRKARFLLAERCAYTTTLANIAQESTFEQQHDVQVESVYDLMFNFSHGPTLSEHSSIYQLFEYIPQVDQMARKQRQRKYNLGSLLDPSAEHIKLQREILQWKPPDEHTSLGRYGSVYQQALLVYLSSVFGQHIIEEGQADYPLPGVLDAFAQFMDLLTPIPSGDLCTKALCWPLAIFGSCARSQSHRDFIRDILLYLYETYGSCSVKQSLCLLETMWADEAQFVSNPLGLMEAMKKTDNIVLFW